MRGREIPAGLYPIVAGVLVKHTGGDYLVMQRDYRKAGYPGKFEAGASGAVLQGEAPHQGALRELQEETGIEAGTLTFLFAVNDLTQTLFFCCLCLADTDTQAITLQAGETIAYRWLPEADFMAFIRSAAFAQEPFARWAPYLSAVKSFGS